MNRILIVVVIILMVLTQFSCKKSELETIRGNTAPPDTSIEIDVYEDYVNRTYILVLGREPDSSEFNDAVTLLTAGLLDSPSRYAFLDEVFSSPDYPWRQFNKNRIELLNNIDTADITIQIFIFNFFLADSTYQALWPGLQIEVDRLEEIQSAAHEYANGVINIRQLQSKMINNYFYDQINMGSDNFVISSFQHFLDRNPTLDEQSNGVSMVNGNNAILFLQAGASRNDYLSILFDSDDYFEGAVIRIYKDYLLRSPSSIEMSVAALKYRNTLDFESVQKDILATDEFAGVD
ncbi:MAG: hypothetical protein IPJ86_08670 [Bacteroidetes bacterium]|nr:hypothetical protein [Bacteroidota bacterium]